MKTEPSSRPSAVPLSLGKWGQMWLDNLRHQRPDEYRTLDESGALHQSAQEANDRAESQYHNLLAQLQRQHAVAKYASYPERVAHMSDLAQQARELVLNELIAQSLDQTT